MLHARNFSALRPNSSKNFEERARAVDVVGQGIRDSLSIDWTARRCRRAPLMEWGE
jgi:hypothetical protein